MVFSQAKGIEKLVGREGRFCSGEVRCWPLLLVILGLRLLPSHGAQLFVVFFFLLVFSFDYYYYSYYYCLVSPTRVLLRAHTRSIRSTMASPSHHWPMFLIWTKKHSGSGSRILKPSNFSSSEYVREGSHLSLFNGLLSSSSMSI